MLSAGNAMFGMVKVMLCVPVVLVLLSLDQCGLGWAKLVSLGFGSAARGMGTALHRQMVSAQTKYVNRVF